MSVGYKDYKAKGFYEISGTRIPLQGELTVFSPEAPDEQVSCVSGCLGGDKEVEGVLISAPEESLLAIIARLPNHDRPVLFELESDAKTKSYKGTYTGKSALIPEAQVHPPQGIHCSADRVLLASLIVSVAKNPSVGDAELVLEETQKH